MPILFPNNIKKMKESRMRAEKEYNESKTPKTKAEFLGTILPKYKIEVDTVGFTRKPGEPEKKKFPYKYTNAKDKVRYGYFDKIRTADQIKFDNRQKDKAAKKEANKNK